MRCRVEARTEKTMSRKTPGNDEIPADLHKTQSYTIVKELTRLFKRIWHEENVQFSVFSFSGHNNLGCGSRDFGKWKKA